MGCGSSTAAPAASPKKEPEGVTKDSVLATEHATDPGSTPKPTLNNKPSPAPVANPLQPPNPPAAAPPLKHDTSSSSLANTASSDRVSTAEGSHIPPSKRFFFVAQNVVVPTNRLAKGAAGKKAPTGNKAADLARDNSAASLPSKLNSTLTSRGSSRAMHAK